MDISTLMRAVEARDDEHAFRARLSPGDWQRLGGVLERQDVQVGDLLIRRGDVGDHAYFIETGQVQVFVGGGRPLTHRIATVHAGSVVGEAGLFGALPRMAHVEAASDGVVWRLGAQRLQGLAADAPQLVLEVMRGAGLLMARRMQANLARGLPLG